MNWHLLVKVATLAPAPVEVVDLELEKSPRLDDFIFSKKTPPANISLMFKYLPHTVPDTYPLIMSSSDTLHSRT